MEDLNRLYAWVTSLPPALVYAVVFGIAYGENVLPPIPGDLIIVIGGMVAALGRVSLPVVVGLSTVAGTLGFLTMYALGRRLGPAALDSNRFRWMPKGALQKAHGWAERYGAGVVLLNRFLPGARSVIALTVGAAGMPAGRVALLSAISAGAWSALIAGLGYTLADNRAAIVQSLRTYGYVAGVLVVLAVVVLVLRGRRRRASEAPVG